MKRETASHIILVVSGIVVGIWIGMFIMSPKPVNAQVPVNTECVKYYEKAQRMLTNPSTQSYALLAIACQAVKR